MSSVHTILSALRFYIRASTIYHVHSPFVFQMLDNLFDARVFYRFAQIENLRHSLLQSHEQINLIDLGAGSQSNLSNNVAISSVAKNSLSSKWQCEILYKLITHFGSSTVIEIGSSLGISTAYLASANKGMTYALEGNKDSIDIAQKITSSLSIENVKFILGNFDKTLPDLLATLNKLDVCFIDGNHRKEATLRYFHMLLPKCNSSSILVFDDIYWSSEMTDAWEQIKQNDEVTLSVDFFYFGLIFLNKDIKSTQHLTVIPSPWKPWQKYF